MKIIALTTCLTVAVSYALATETLLSPKWISIVNPEDTANVPSQRLDSRSTCDIQTLTNCMLTFFGNIGLSNTSLPNGTNIQLQFRAQRSLNPPQGFIDLCSYLANFWKCSSPSDCWTLSNMEQLNFPDGNAGADKVVYTLYAYLYICIDGYQTAVNNINCINYATANAPFSCQTVGTECQRRKQLAACEGDFYDKECNKDVGIMFCHASISAVKGTYPTLCNSTDLDNACNGIGDQISSSTPSSSPYHIPSAVPVLFIALFAAVLKHT